MQLPVAIRTIDLHRVSLFLYLSPNASAALRAAVVITQRKWGSGIIAIFPSQCISIYWPACAINLAKKFLYCFMSEVDNVPMNSVIIESLIPVPRSSLSRSHVK